MRYITKSCFEARSRSLPKGGPKSARSTALESLINRISQRRKKKKRGRQGGKRGFTKNNMKGGLGACPGETGVTDETLVGKDLLHGGSAHAFKRRQLIRWSYRRLGQSENLFSSTGDKGKGCHYLNGGSRWAKASKSLSMAQKTSDGTGGGCFKGFSSYKGASHLIPRFGRWVKRGGN